MSADLQVPAVLTGNPGHARRWHRCGTIPVIRCSANATDLRGSSGSDKDPGTPAGTPGPGQSIIRYVTNVTVLRVPAVLTEDPGTPAFAPSNT
jgi:hypothetical protein